MMKFIRNSSVAATLVFSAPFASAQNAARQSCQFQPLIISLAKNILEMRPSLPPRRASRIGTNAAYLLLRYENMPVDDGISLISQIREDGAEQPRALDDLEIAYAISKLGVRAGLSLNSQDPLEVFSRARASVLRAIILSDGGQSFFELLAEIQSNPEQREYFRQSYLDQNFLTVFLRDQSDEFKRSFARMAEENGAFVLAGMMLANLSDLAEYRAYLERYADDDDVFQAIKEVRAQAGFLVQLSQTAPTEILRSVTSAERVRNQRTFGILKAELLSRQLSFFYMVYVGSGHDIYSVDAQEGLGLAARQYISAVQSGSLTLTDDPEAAWLFTYKALIDELGPSHVREALSKLSVAPWIRHFATSTSEILNWAVAKAAIAPYMRGETDTLPARPEYLSKNNIDWEAWTRLAALIRPMQTLPDGSIPDFDTAAAIELLYLQGEVDRAITLAARDLPPEDLVYVYRDMMTRLDLRCEAVSDYPGNMALLGGRTLFKFPSSAQGEP